MSNEKNTEPFDKKSSYSNENKIITEKELNFLFTENKELRENNCKLLDKKDELERKIKHFNIKLDEDENFITKENIYNKEIKIEELKETVKLLEKEKEMSIGKIVILEGVLKKELNIEDVFKTMAEKEILKYFNDMVIKNIDKKDELKRQNKLLMENVIMLGKEYNRRKFSKEKENN